MYLGAAREALARGAYDLAGEYARHAGHADVAALAAEARRSGEEAAAQQALGDRLRVLEAENAGLRQGTVDLDTVTNGMEDGGLPGADTGVFFNDDASLNPATAFGDTGVDFRGMAENVFAAPATKTGLLGVDVPLPREGKVFHFRSLSSGASITLTPSRPGTSEAGRWALFALLLVGLTLLARGVSIVRRR
jgi:hypothetical protein